MICQRCLVLKVFQCWFLSEPELSYILAELFNMCLKESCFWDCWKNLSMVPVFKNVGDMSTAKNYHSVSLLSVVSKVFKKLVNNRVVDHQKNAAYFLFYSMVLGLLDQLQIFWQLHPVELLGLFLGLGATWVIALDISKLFDRVWHSSLLQNFKSYEISRQMLALFDFLLVIDGFKWFWIESLHKNIQLMQEFLKVQFLV